MTFIWPSMLFALLVIPIVVVLYLRLQRRQRVLASSFYRSSSGIKITRGQPGIRRHLPSLIFLLGLAVLIVALARPQALLSLPRLEGTVMLVFDVSASMGATDADPSRLEAAKKVAREFVISQPTTVQIGIVSFSGSGFTVQAPTNDSGSLLATINRLEPTSGTSLGQGIASALNAIAVDAGLADEEAGAVPTPTPARANGQGTSPMRQAEADLLARLPAGKYPSSKIVLLSDGENNQSIDPIKAAEAATEHGVPIDTLGFGTATGVTLEVDGYRIHTALDESTLEQIADASGGTYLAANDDQDPQQVDASLAPQVVVKADTMEVTSVFACVSVVILIVGSLFSTIWFGRLV